MRIALFRRGVAGGVRRRLGRVVAIGLLASTASLARSEPAWAECSSSPTVDSYGGAGPLGPIGFLGDSTGIGMIEVGTIVAQLRAAGWGPIRASAICGGHTFGTNQFAGPVMLADWRRTGFDPPVYLLNFGSNDVGFCEDRLAECRRDIDGMLANIGDDHQVVWQNISHPRPDWETAWNTALADAAKVHPLVTVSDWVSAVNADPTLTTWDRVHAANGTAYQFRSKLSVDAAARWARANTVTGTPVPPTAVGAPASFDPLVAPARVVDTRDGTGGSRLGAGAQLTVDLSALVPAGATAAAVNLTVDAASAGGYLTAWDCQGPAPTVSALNHPARSPRAAHAVVTLHDGRFCVTTKAATDVIVDVFGSYGAGGALRFNPATPTRLLDTRDRSTTPLVPGTVTEVTVPAVAGVTPAAAVFNLTAVGALNPGYVSAYPCGGTTPRVSAVNVDSAAPRANLVQVTVGAGGKVCLLNQTAMHLVVDLAGVYGTTGLQYQAAVPVRLVDTRTGAGGWLGAPASLADLALPTVPGAEALTVTTTVASPSGSGYATLHPCGGEPSTVSNVNYGDGETTANAAIVGVGSCVLTKARGQVVIDLTGWWVA